MIKFLIKLFLSLASLYITMFFLIAIFQEKMIFMPESLPQHYQYNFNTDFKELFLVAEDGAKLNALHFKVDKPKGVVLYFHGNAGELASWGEVVQKFVDRDYDVLVMDYRGYGKSTGSRTEKALYKDAEMFYEYVLRGYSENDIVVYGRSLGTTFATYVAAINHPRELILEAPFYSLDEVASHRFPIYPVKTFLKFHFPTYKYIQQVRSPIFIFHGTGDKTVPYANSIKLSKLVNPEKLTFISISGADHNDVVDTEEYHDELDDIL